MIVRLILAELRHRPGRALFLLGGYALGVAVMVVLLAVGEAMLSQSRDRALIGGGDLTVVPAGISTEMLRAGGAGTRTLGLDQARFLQRELFESPRAREEIGIVSASPVLDDRRLELFPGGRRLPAIATGEVPSRADAAGARPDLLSGAWRDSDADRRWTDPTDAEFYAEIDGFHIPTGEAARDSTWAEWHYFNVLLDDDRWIYLTLAVGGAMAEPDGWGGQILLTVRAADGTHRSITRDVPGESVQFDTASPDLTLANAGSVTFDGDRYRVSAEAEDARLEFELTPARRRYLPPTDLSGTALTSGYVAPALFGRVNGTLCLPECVELAQADGYHDHNWGVWRDVSWEWGAASNDSTSLLYGMVRSPETDDETLFAYLMDDRGPRGIFRPAGIRYTETQTVTFEGSPLEVPRRMAFEDARRGVSVDIDIGAVHVTDTGADRPERRYFVQMRGEAVVREGERAEAVSGFFETYVDG